MTNSTVATTEAGDENTSHLQELLEFAKKDQSKVLEVVSHIAGLSGTSEGIALLLKEVGTIVQFLVANYQLPTSTKHDVKQIKLHVCSALSNLLASDGAKDLREGLSSFFTALSSEKLMKRVLKDALKEPEEDEKLLRLRTVILLGNATALSTEVCSSVLAFANKNSQLNILDRMYGISLDVSELGTAFLSVVSNLTQTAEFRTWILSPKKPSLPNDIRLKSLLPYATFSPCARRREAVMAALKNCCFSTDYHDKLVDQAFINVLPALLLPLADGSNKLTDEENGRLIVELRYLETSVKREPAAIIRMSAVEALYQLCATKTGREALRNSGAYLILREYHRWEESDGKNEAISQHLFDVIEIIISDEHIEKKFEDLHKVDIPEDLKSKFEGENKQN